MPMTQKIEPSPASAYRASLLDAQPGPIQALVQYCLALAVVEMGQARLISATPGDTGPICTFETATGQHISLAKPPLNVEQEIAVKRMFLRILEEKGL
jgi:hypothetical protein